MNERQQKVELRNGKPDPVVLESARVLLRQVFRILRGCGIDPETLQSIRDEALDCGLEIPSAHANGVSAHQALVCSDIILRWRRSPKFLTSEGLPAQLSVDGRKPSFVELVDVAAPGTNWRDHLSAMSELGVARLVSDKKVELLSDSVVACSGRDGSLVEGGFVLEHIRGFLGSVEYNMFDKPTRETGRFERACYAAVPEEVVPVLEKLISTRGQDFVDVVDEWLARRSIKPSSQATAVLVGAGAYVFVRKNRI